MRINQIEILGIICKPIAIYIVALELNASFLMLLLAYALSSASFKIIFNKE